MKRSRLLLFAVLVLVNLAVALTVIPAASAQTSGGCTAYHTVQRGDTLYSIARRYGTTVQQLQSFNGIANANQIYAGQTLCVWNNAQNPYPQPSDSSYTVQPGDTLFSIARRYGLNVYQLASLNGIWNPSRIYVGQVLRIPSGQGPLPTPVPAQPRAELLSIIESNNVNSINGVYWITNGWPFFVNVQASNATGVAFYLQNQWGQVTLLGEDTYAGDGWGVQASLADSPFSGTIYAIAYNAQGAVAQSNVISVRR